MSSSCDEYFSLANLEGSSLETEIGYSTLCVPNKLKAAVFVLSIVAFTLVTILCSVLLVQEFLRRPKWTWKTRGYLIYAIQAEACAIINAMHLGGVQNRYRYLIFFLPWTLMVVNTILKLDLFMATTRAVKKMVVQADTTPKPRQAIRLTMLGLLVVVLLLVGAILPIVYYDDKWALNWLYSFFIFSISFIALVAVNVLAYLNYTLAARCERTLDMSDDTMAPLVVKLKDTVKLAIGVSMMTVGLCFFPLWMGLTHTETDPGMRGHFYFHYLFYQGINFLGVFAGIWNQMQATRGDSTSGSSEQKMSSGGPFDVPMRKGSGNTESTISSIKKDRI